MRIITIILITFISSQITHAHEAGFQFFKFTDSLEGAIFYPSDQKETLPTALGDDFLIQAQQNAAIKNDNYPLIIISHGYAGSRLSHHDTAEFLARQGFVVATIEHSGDNYRDQSASGTKEYWPKRAKAISMLIDHLLSDPVWHNHINSNQIGFLGYSAGTPTGLLLAGAKADFTLFDQYCQKTKLNPPYCQFSQPKGITAFVQQQNLSDIRIKGYFLLAPVALMFDDATLALINRPVHLVSAEYDKVVEGRANVERIARQLPQLVNWDTISSAGHFVFLSPCSEKFTQELPFFCQDPQGVDRIAIHNQFNQRASDFFRFVLGISQN